MISHRLHQLIVHHLNTFQNLSKTCVATFYVRTSQGTRALRRARKYKRPEDLEDPFYYGVGPKKTVESAYQSLSDRGFTKEQQSYQPPSNVEEQLHKICQKVFGTQLNLDWKSQCLDDSLLKYKLLTKSMHLFKKNIPNSYLHKMKDVSHLLEFFSTPVDGSLPYDALIRDSEKLPPNLHVMHDSVTFNPETDTFFDGVTAFPGRKRIIHTKTGQKFEKNIQWPNI